MSIITVLTILDPSASPQTGLNEILDRYADMNYALRIELTWA